MPESNDVFEIMRTTRAMRRLKPDPVPDELVHRILEAGICAASGGHRPPPGGYERLFREAASPFLNMT